MSIRDFSRRFVFQVTPRSLVLAVSLFLVSGCATVALAVSPQDVIDTTNAVAGMNALQLMAAVALGALSLCCLMLWMGYKVIIKTTIAITQLADSQKNMICLAKKPD